MSDLDLSEYTVVHTEQASIKFIPGTSYSQSVEYKMLTIDEPAHLSTLMQLITLEIERISPIAKPGGPCEAADPETQR